MTSRWVDAGDTRVEVLVDGDLAPRVLAEGDVVVTAHPVDVMQREGVARLREATGGRPVVAINPRGAGGDVCSLETMVSRLEAVRAALGVERWIFWGLSGGGWLGLLYASRFAARTRGLVLESIDAHFRTRLDDPACVVSPRHPAWSSALEAADLSPLPPEVPAEELAWVPLAGVPDAVEQGGEALVARGGVVLVAPAPLEPAMKAMMPHLLKVDLRELVGDLDAPGLVLAGDRDPMVPLAHAESLHHALPHSTLAILAGGGHVASVLGPEALRQAAAQAFARWCGDLRA